MVFNWFKSTKTHQIFVLKLFKMILNETICSSFGQRSVIKFLPAEKTKPYEIDRRMYNVHGEICFSKMHVYKWTKPGFAATIQGLEAYWLSTKENVPGAVTCKEGLDNIFLRYERTHHFGMLICQYLMLYLLNSILKWNEKVRKKVLAFYNRL